MIKKIVHFFVVLLLCTTAAQAATERVVTSRAGVLGNPITVNSTLTVQDQWFGFMLTNATTWYQTFFVKETYADVVLRYDDKLRYVNATDWELVVTYSITVKDSDGTASTTTGQTLTIDHEPGAGGVHTDQIRKRYLNAHYAKITVTGIAFKSPKSGSASSTIPVDLNDIYLDLEISTERYYRINTATVPTLQRTDIDLNADSNPDEIELQWNYLQGAESYDVEWLFIDAGSLSVSTTNFAYDFKNAVRVNVPTQHYNITLAYPKGVLLYRIRGVGMDQANFVLGNGLTRKEGAWSTSVPESGFLTTNSVSGNAVRYNVTTGLHEDLNWSYSIGFAEDGKKGESFSIADATLKPRQSIGKVNSDNTMVVGESRYDHEGRPAMSIMPSPLENKGFHYYTGIASDFSARSTYDTDANIATQHTLNSANPGAGNYYSGSNSVPGANGYTPDAEGMPYARVIYMTDGSGRVRSSSSVGKELGHASGRETKYFYGTPTQEQLDRLFGNEVGFVKHYKKNFVVDPNGQTSVVYLDQEGRTIATALAGDVPANLVELDDQQGRTTATNMHDDMLGNNVKLGDMTMQSQTTLTVVSDNTQHDFEYELLPINVCPVVDCYEPCESCKYNLRIHIEDDLGTTVDLDTGDPLETDIVATAMASGTYTFTVTLDVGTYSVIKTLEMDTASLNAAVNEYADSLLTGNYDSCYPAVTGVSDMCPENCEDACLQAFKRYDAEGDVYYQRENGDTTTNFAVATVWINDCIEKVCNTISVADPCELKKEAMLADLRPGGQYFDNTPARFLADTAGGLVEDTAYFGNKINDWLENHPNETDMLGAINTYAGTSYTSWDTIRANYNPDWADTLLQFHPEYCAWNFFCNWQCIPAGAVPDTLTTADAHAYYLKMLNSNSGHYVDTSMDYDLFNPMNADTGNGNPNQPRLDQSDYLPFMYKGHASHIDPLFVCNSNICNDGVSAPVYAASRLDTHLRRYMAVLDTSNNVISNRYYSVWYLIDNPDTLNYKTKVTSGVSQHIIDLFKVLHGDTVNSIPALISPDNTPAAGQITKYEYFKSVYLFFRELVRQQDFYGDSSTIACQVANYGDTINGDFLANDSISPLTADGFVIYFPKMPMLDIYGDGCAVPLITVMIDSIQSMIEALEPQVPEDVPSAGSASCSCAGLQQFISDEGLTITDLDDIATALNENLELESPDLITGTDVGLWLSRCDSDTVTTAGLLALGMPSELICDITLPEGPLDSLVYAGCQEEEDLDAGNSADFYNDNLLAQLKQAYRDSLVKKCMDSLRNKEFFTVDYELKEYYYTLYYYDQAGNLIKTVLPEGVNIITNTVTLTQVKNYRNAVSGSTYTPAVHDMLSIYKYNSMQQTREATSTDGGKSEYWYDYLGRLIVSQNAKQASSSNFSPLAYSYTQYDVLGRIQEVGQVQSSTAMDDVVARQSGNYYYFDNTSPTDYENWLSAVAASKRQVTSTWYDEEMTAVHADVTAAFGSGGQKNLRNRVAAVQFDDDPTSTAISSIYYPGNTPTGQKKYQHAQHYSYDIHGNVNTAISETPALEAIQQHIKKTTYGYDLISGNVNEVNYQESAFDQFYHKYEYDADNRLTIAYSSKDKVHWEKESKQFYYQHGGASRVEIGDKIVQGSDFVYTLQGWLKAVNRNTLGGTNNAYSLRDAGLDAVNSGSNINRNVGNDAYGFTLGYYKAGTGDYNPISVPINNFEAATSGSDFRSAGVDQYNGNISNAVYAITASDQTILEHQGSTYKYDQLYRLKQVNTWHNIDLSGNAWNSGSTNDLRYKEYFSYDFNGNITRAKRYSGTLSGGTATIMDSLAYYYNKTGGTYDAYSGSPSDATNKLNYVSDQITDCTFQNGDLDNQAHNNYLYDEIGQLLKDGKEYITSIEWTPYQKVSKVIKDNSVKVDPCDGVTPLILQDLEFWYDASGARLCKIVKPHEATGGVSNQNKWVYTWYSYDASGNVMAVYKQTHEFQSGSTYKAKYNVEEYDVYGGGRLGIRHGDAGDKYECNLTASITSGQLDGISWSSCTAPIPPHGNGAEYKRTLGEKQYELSNHLGNVIATVSDKRLAVADITISTNLAFYSPDVLSHTDYYAFGASKVDRTGAETNYRYGFNGVEKDDEVKGDGNSYNTDFRMYDPRVGRWLSIDPITHPFQSPYTAFNDNPIYFSDPSGLKGKGPGGDDPSAVDRPKNTLNAPTMTAEELSRQSVVMRDLPGDELSRAKNAGFLMNGWQYFWVPNGMLPGASYPGYYVRVLAPEDATPTTTYTADSWITMPGRIGTVTGIVTDGSAIPPTVKQPPPPTKKPLPPCDDQVSNNTIPGKPAFFNKSSSVDKFLDWENSEPVLMKHSYAILDEVARLAPNKTETKIGKTEVQTVGNCTIYTTPVTTTTWETNVKITMYTTAGPNFRPTVNQRQLIVAKELQERGVPSLKIMNCPTINFNQPMGVMKGNVNMTRFDITERRTSIVSYQVRTVCKIECD